MSTATGSIGRRRRRRRSRLAASHRMTTSLPLPHHGGARRLGDLVDIGHLEHARGDQDDLAIADQIAAAEAEVERAPRDSRTAFKPMAKPRAAYEFGAERHRGMRPADARGIARACPHHHVGHRHQQTAMGPTHGIAVARLERQPDAQPLAFRLAPERADQIDESVGDRQLAEAFGNERALHVASPSLEAAYVSSAARTAGLKAVLRWVCSLSDTMIAFSTAVQWPSSSNRAWPMVQLRAPTSTSRAQAVARPG